MGTVHLVVHYYTVPVSSTTHLMVVPDSVHSDQGWNFESEVFLEMCMLLGLNKTRSTAYHPEKNGQVENLHWTMKSLQGWRSNQITRISSWTSGGVS